MEEKVTQLKEGVFQSKARARELEEAVLRGKIMGTKAVIRFSNQAEGFFALSSAEFRLDGNLISKIDTEESSAAAKKKPVDEDFLIFDGDIPAGDHTLEIWLLYRGSDKSIYTMLSYEKDHKFNLKGVEKFSVDYGKSAEVKLTALDRGYFKKDVAERLALDIRTTKEWGSEVAQ